MELDIEFEKAKVTNDLKLLSDRLSGLNKARNELMSQIAMRQGILQYLNSLGGNDEPNNDESKPED